MAFWEQAPIYVTRKTTDGYIGQYSVSLGVTLTIMVIAMANAIGWGLYGLYALGALIV